MMKKKSLRPQQTAPVQRQTTATTTSTGVGVGALTYCDIATKLCTPFAGEDAE